MKPPKLYKDGLNYLLRYTAPEHVAVVKVESRRFQQCIDALAHRFFGDVPQARERIFEYTPPSWLSRSIYNEDGRRLVRLAERIPQIEDPNLIYVVIDDTVHTGRVAHRATLLLEKQGISRNNLWFLTHLAMLRAPRDSPFLDKADRFIGYAARHS